MGSNQVPPLVEQKYFQLRAAGYSQAKAARDAGCSPSYANKKLEPMRNFVHDDTTSLADLPPVKRLEDLPENVKRALNDFGYYQLRYFGRIPIPWQTKLAHTVAELLETPEREYLVVNAPPGAGKTTELHDIAAWVTTRRRAIRGLYGSATKILAERYVNRLRRTLGRTSPVLANEDLKAAGLAVDADAVLAKDFGRFRPIDRELWTHGEFVVEQHGRASIVEKEPTWSSYGADSGQIGGRFDFVIWDDLVTPQNTRSEEAAQKLRDDYDDVSESRLEPGGLLVLVGQRLGPEDLYRYCLDKVVEVGEDEEGEPVGEEARYKHLVYKAHYEELCRPGSHRRDAEPWPDGCLLSPRRITWRDIRGKMSDRNERFLCVYQQEDVDSEGVLVNPDWIDGKGDFPGCLDHERDLLELPEGLYGDTFSVASADPSPAKYWGIEHWVYHPDTEQRFLVNLDRRAMTASEFLDFNHSTGRFTGVMEEWQQLSIDIGYPITHWIVETNACARFLLQYEHVHHWIRRRSVDIVSHETHRNKADPDFGVQTIAPHYRYGRKRLPFKPNSEGRKMSLRLREELTKWKPAGRFTDDLVMADWFFEYQLPHLYRRQSDQEAAHRPSWAGGVPDMRRGRRHLQRVG